MSLFSFSIKYGKYKCSFGISSKYTIIQGKSGTGKSTLIEYVEELINAKLIGEATKGDMGCSKECVVLTVDDWEQKIKKHRDCLIFIDEDDIPINNSKFIQSIVKSNNYFVLVLRDKLFPLPYGYKDVYEMVQDGDHNVLQKVYRYTEQDVKPDAVITEDSKSGHTFFNEYFKKCSIICESSGGRDKLITKVRKLRRSGFTGRIFIIADGAGLGPTAESIFDLVDSDGNISIWLPESFEWLLMHSPMFKGKYNEIINNVRDISAREYENAEQYCTKVLEKDTKGTKLEYSKKSDLKCYTHSCIGCGLRNKDKCKYAIECSKKEKLEAIIKEYPKKILVEHHEEDGVDIFKAAEADFMNEQVNKDIRYSRKE